MAKRSLQPIISGIAGRRRALLALVALALATAAGFAPGPFGRVAAQDRPPYLDPARPLDARVEDLLARLTLEEKVGLVHANGKFRAGGVERLGVPYLWTADGPQGVREEVGVDSWEPAGWTNDFATAMPVGMALASTWDTELAEAYGRDGRGRGPRARQARDPRPRAEHPENAAVRPQLRLLRRRPVARRPHHRGLREGHAGRADDRLSQALRRQQPGAGPRLDRRAGGRAAAPGDLPAGVRGGSARGRGARGDGCLQQGPRRAHGPQRLPAQPGAQARVGLRGRRHLRLGRHPRHPRGRPEGPRPRDGHRQALRPVLPRRPLPGRAEGRHVPGLGARRQGAPQPAHADRVGRARRPPSRARSTRRRTRTWLSASRGTGSSCSRTSPPCCRSTSRS